MPSRLTRPLLPPPEGFEAPALRLLVLGSWLVLALLETAKEWVAWRLRAAPRSWSDVALVNLPWWLYWAALTPAVMLLARRVPLSWRGGRGLAAWGVHLAASVVAALGHALFVSFFAWFGLTRGPGFSSTSFLHQARTVAEGYLVLHVFVYWMILAAYQGLLWHRRWVEARVREAELGTLAAEARLEALRMELDPHFLFNALNAVSGLVRRGDGGAATTMLARVSELLRATLRTRRETLVPLDEELALLDLYLAVERVRFGDRLTVLVAVEPPARRALVPPLLLQPLAENAFRHGVARRPGPARVEVRARRDGGELVLEVEDGGDGGTAAPATGEPAMESGGTGLRNVRERVRTLSGDADPVRIERADGGGTRVAVRLPWRERPATPPPGPAA